MNSSLQVGLILTLRMTLMTSSTLKSVERPLQAKGVRTAWELEFSKIYPPLQLWSIAKGGDAVCCFSSLQTQCTASQYAVVAVRIEILGYPVSGSFSEQNYQRKTSMNKQHVRLWLEVKNRCQGPCGRNSQGSWMVSTLLQEVAYSFVLGRGHDLDGNVQLWTSSFWSTCGKTDSRVGKTMRVNPNFDHIWNISDFKNCSKPSPRPLWHGTGADAARLPVIRQSIASASGDGRRLVPWPFGWLEDGSKRTSTKQDMSLR